MSVGWNLLAVAIEQLVADTNTSREMQQRAVTWMGTTTSALIIGALVYVGQSKNPSGVAVTTLLGIATPAAGLFASLIFLGELWRQGRVAVLLRSLESWAAREPTLQVGIERPIPAIFVETQYRNLDGKTGRYGMSIYYLAVLAVFGSSVILGPVLDTMLTLTSLKGGIEISVNSISVPLAAVTGTVFSVVWGGATYWQARRIQELAEREISLEVTEP